MVRLWRVTNYEEFDFWFSSYADAANKFRAMLKGDHVGCQERIEMLEFVRYGSSDSSMQVILAILNGKGWADEINTIRRARD